MRGKLSHHHPRIGIKAFNCSGPSAVCVVGGIVVVDAVVVVIVLVVVVVVMMMKLFY